jgi:lipoprotein NlpD
VQEGQRVKRGQPIAEVGRDAHRRELLHFEVRRRGRPIDPLTVLPAQP